MPDALTFLSTWRLDPWAAAAILAAGLLYGRGLRAAARRGIRWPLRRSAAFFVLGLGSLAWIQFGFLGTWSHDLRWAFTTRIAFLLFLTPALMALGRPVALARAALQGRALAAVEAVLRSWPLRLLGNAMVAPLVALAGFSVFLTPLAATLRLSPGWEVALTLGVPLLGLAMALPLAEDARSRSGMFVVAEFLLAFGELIADAIPGIVLRIQPVVLDGATRMAAGMPHWFPTPLRDQQLSGDLLWAIAELGDLPVLILLLLRWTRADRRDARTVDALSDEEYEAQVQAHLRGQR